MLVLCDSLRIQLTILGMFNLHIFRLNARLFLLICMDSLENLLPVSINYFKLGYTSCRVV